MSTSVFFLIQIAIMPKQKLTEVEKAVRQRDQAIAQLQSQVEQGQKQPNKKRKPLSYHGPTRSFSGHVLSKRAPPKKPRGPRKGMA